MRWWRWRSSRHGSSGWKSPRNGARSTNSCQEIYRFNLATCYLKRIKGIIGTDNEIVSVPILNKKTGCLCMDSMDKTMKFDFSEEPIEENVKAVLLTVYQSLREKGYHPINQIVGYLLSGDPAYRSEEHTSELQSRGHIVCRLLPEK